MQDKLTLVDLWAIERDSAYKYYFGRKVKTDDIYLTMVYDSVNCLSENDRKIAQNKDFIRLLIKNRNLPHGERLSQSLYELEGGILSDENMELFQEEMKFEKFDFNKTNYVVYESKFTFFDYLNASEKEIQQKKNSNFFKHCTLYLKGQKEFLQNFTHDSEKMHGVFTLILENNNLSDNLLYFDLSFLENLYLNNNNLSEIHNDALKDKLKHLDISYNNFRNFSFYCLPLTIRSINLSNNPLAHLDLRALKFLEILDLSNTELEILENLPKTITTLTLNNCNELKKIVMIENYIINLNSNVDFILQMYDSYIDVLTTTNNNVNAIFEYSYINTTNDTNLLI